MDKSRRKFLGTTLTGAALAISLPEIVKAAIAPATSAPKIRIAENDVILFQGDSITDAGRDKKNMAPNNSGALGHGYALLRSEEHTSELQSLMRISYAVFCLKKKNYNRT